jgi:hypothetical protein
MYIILYHDFKSLLLYDVGTHHGLLTYCRALTIFSYIYIYIHIGYCKRWQRWRLYVDLLNAFFAVELVRRVTYVVCTNAIILHR